MKLSIKYFLLLCIMCLSTTDVCAQKAIIKSPKIPKIKPPRVKPTVNWTAIVAHEVRKVNEASSKASTTTSKNTKLPDVRLTIPQTKNSKKKQQESLSSLLSSQGLYRLDSLLKESYVLRFVNYARINSQSTEGEDVAAFPLSMGQRQMARLVEQDLLKLAKNNKSLQVVRSESEYVYAKLPATTKRKLPSIMLMAHLDITPEAPGGNIKPIVHRNYQGGDIVLPSGVVLSPESPQGKHLKECIGKTIITSDGNTLLGADDKTGCTVLVSLICNLLYGKPFEHGDLYFVFSQNEDIGRAADGFETKYVGGNPDVVIDVDGDDPHAFSVENFTAAMRIYTFHGKSAHPSVSRGKQGYIHCYDISHPKDSAGKVISDDYLVKVRLRYFDKLEGDTLRQMLDSAEGKTIDAFPFVKVEASVEILQYENVAYTMYPTLPDIIKKAYASLGKKVSPRSERGGTTSAMIAAKGLRGGACLFSGQQAEHSIYEWTCVEDMMDMTKILQKIIMLINK